MATFRRLPSDREAAFPNLFNSGYNVTSEEDYAYNCIAWAAEDKDQCWNPFCIGHGYFWPDGLERKADVETFVKLYSITCGYVKCDSPDLEFGFEKIALYVGPDGEITHAARQIKDGTWTSKLGDWEDIGHKALEGFDESIYGKAICFLKRPISATFSIASV